MNLLLFTTSLEKNAVTMQLLELAKFLQERMHKVELLTHEEIPEEIKSYFLTYYPSISIKSLHCKRIEIFRAVFKFRKKLNNTHVDIVHCHLGRAYIIALLGKKKGIKILATFHNNKNYFSFFTKTFLTLFLKKFDGITAVSKTALKSYVKKTSQKKIKTRVIYNPIFIKRTLKENVFKLPEQIFSSKHFVIGTANRFVQGKGYEFLLDLAQTIKKNKITAREKKIVFWLAGEGPLEELYKRKVEVLEIPHVFFLGFRTDIMELIRNTQLMLYPSQNEGFGLGVYEALLSGVPTLAQKMPVFTELLGENSPWLIDFCNNKEVIHTVKKIIKTYSKFTTLAKNEFLPLQKTLDIDNIFNQYLNFYNEYFKS